jgi:diaminohydroxyphosphoribosylaminopyrimidine deaminase/5-amino-6-(5-phosphoribosylamino)uracil reductase
VSGAAGPSAATDFDRRMMGAAIRLARRNLGLTGPNPSVGAICVAETAEGVTVVGRGVTAPGGRPHAEPQALAQAGERARGATLYVTLEPCSHHGKTPPCADAVVAAGIARVVVARDDPDPRVAGRGYARLREAGITVVRGVEAAAAYDGLAGFLSRVTRARPEVLLKLAVSADGMIGRQGVPNFPITGPAARARAQLMRAEADAIAVGIGTAALDDPELTVRLVGLEQRSPMRVVFDRDARLSPDSRLARSAGTVPVRVVADLRREGVLDRLGALAALGAPGIGVSSHPDGRLDLAGALECLAATGVNTLMVEGGAMLAESFLVEGLVDRIALFRSGVIVGAEGVPAPPSLAGRLGADGGFRCIGREVWGDDLLEIWDGRGEAQP